MNLTYTREVIIGLVLVSSAIGAAALAADPAPGTDGDRQAQARARLQACRSDAQHFCSAVESGGGRKLACLRMHIAELTPACRDALPAAPARKGGPVTNDGGAK
jgi:hypothetical protein